MPNLIINFSVGDDVWAVNVQEKRLNFGEIVAIEYVEYFDANQIPYSEVFLTVSDDVANCVLTIPQSAAYELRDEALIALSEIVENSSNC